MAGKLYRTQILLEPEQHRELAEIARREGRSLSDVVRQMLREQLDRRREDREEAHKRRMEVLRGLQERREQFLKENGGKPIDFDVVEAINQAREVQDERNFRLLTGSGD